VKGENRKKGKDGEVEQYLLRGTGNDRRKRGPMIGRDYSRDGNEGKERKEKKEGKEGKESLIVFLTRGRGVSIPLGKKGLREKKKGRGMQCSLLRPCKRKRGSQASPQ